MVGCSKRFFSYDGEECVCGDASLCYNCENIVLEEGKSGNKGAEGVGNSCLDKNNPSAKDDKEKKPCIECGGDMDFVFKGDICLRCINGCSVGSKDNKVTMSDNSKIDSKNSPTEYKTIIDGKEYSLCSCKKNYGSNVYSNGIETCYRCDCVIPNKSNNSSLVVLFSIVVLVEVIRSQIGFIQNLGVFF